MMDYTKELKEFVSNNPRLKDNIGYLTVSGSIAYGTNVATSDIDVRGFFFESLDELISIFNKKNDVVEDSVSDTVVYSFKKFIELVTACNPNVIEMLGTREEDVIEMHPIARYMRHNAEMFLSKRAYHIFSGYAFSQLRRLENALKPDDKRTKKDFCCDSFALIKTKESEYNKLLSSYSNFSYIQIDKGLIVDGKLSNIPITEMIHIFMDMNSIIKNYEKIGHRNNKKTIEKLHKHEMHLIRLYYMGIDILKHKQINTYRTKERDFLLDIRNGKVSLEDIFALRKELDSELKDAYINSTLPEELDKKYIDEFYANFVKGRYVK